VSVRLTQFQIADTSKQFMDWGVLLSMKLFINWGARQYVFRFGD